MAKNHKDLTKKPSSRPAFTGEDRERQLTALAMDLAEKKLRDGTASNQTICYFLKLGSDRERLERENLRHEIELKTAKKAALESAKQIEELYTNALEAIRSYSGQVDDEDILNRS